MSKFSTVEIIKEDNLYARFGISDGLTEDELMDVDGGFCFSCDCFFATNVPGCIVKISTGCGS